MRIWSLHPRFLDRQGLLGLWRETIQAKNALLDPQHSSNVYHERQLRRFRSHETKKSAIICIAKYLHCVADEMILRDYRPSLNLIPYYTEEGLYDDYTPNYIIPVTSGQIEFEIQHLKAKLIERKAPELLLLRLTTIRQLFYTQLNPIFKEVGGDIEPWEKL
jgi:hypothetical protein